MMADIEDLAARSRVTESGCWEWDGYRNELGYGICVLRRQRWRAHRLAWAYVHGPIPDGMVICHRCDNPPCINPDHLFLGTHRDNTADMMRKGRNAYVNPMAGKTHCKHGHEFTPENTYVQPSQPTYRRCLTCEKARRKALWASRTGSRG
jgi:hypothetical protein